MKKNSGMSLVEVVVSLAIAGIVGMIAATFLSRQSETTEELKASMAMQAIAKKVETSAARPEVVRASALYAPFLTHPDSRGNQLLLNCITTQKSGAPVKPDCTITSAEAQIAFDLILPVGKNLDKATVAKNTIAGGEFPLLYNLHGFKDCFLDGHNLSEQEIKALVVKRQPLDPACQFEVKTYFWANCPVEARGQEKSPGATLFAKTCATAASINIRYQIRHVVPFTLSINKFSKVLPAIPLDLVFKQNPYFGAITVPVAAIPDLSMLDLACPPNESISGIVEGKPVCACLPPFKLMGSEGAPRCEAIPKKCAPRERYRGVKPDGSAICQTVSCEIVDSNIGCRPGGWIEQIMVFADNPLSPLTSGCRGNVCWVGKNGGECTSEVRCDGMMRCCYEISPQVMPAPLP